MKGCLVILIMACAISCSEKNKPGVTVIPREKMTKIIWDIIQVDEFVSAHLASDSSADIIKQRVNLYARVFRIHNVSKDEFSTSFTYYSGRPDVMKILFDTLGARAERERANVYLPRDSQ